MYSWEIEQLLKLKNYLISNKEYLEICKSTQIDHIKYENEAFNIWTSDGYKFILKIKLEHK